jgi:hypothetical protein
VLLSTGTAIKTIIDIANCGTYCILRPDICYGR